MGFYPLEFDFASDLPRSDRKYRRIINKLRYVECFEQP